MADFPIITHAPLPQTLMGIDSYRHWERFALEVETHSDRVIVRVVEAISLTESKVHSSTTVPVPHG